MNKPKRHHYLPQFYLNFYCRGGGLWLFDRERREYRQQTPKNTALKQHYYSTEATDGEKDTRIEELLSIVEGHAKIVIDKLVAREAITHNEKEELAIFVAFMIGRVPGFEKSVNEVHEQLIRHMCEVAFSDEARVQAIMDDRERDTGEKPEVSAKDLVNFQKRGEYDIGIHRNASLELMLSLSMDLANYFQQMDWCVHHAPSKSTFITTDNPFVLIPPKHRGPRLYGTGIITPGAMKVFPLAPSACLVMYDHGNDISHRELDAPKVRSMNNILACHSDRFVIARDEVHLRSVVAGSRIENREPLKRFTIR
jgi:hypothetical protein